MPLTNRTAHRKMIALAKQHDDLDDLVYYVEMTLPQALRPRPDADKMPVTHPPGWIPTIPLSPDSKAANQWAHLLTEIVKEGRGIVFRTELSSRLYMQELGLTFYEWGEDLSDRTVDWICPTCGTVERVAVGETGTCCTRQRERRPLPPIAYPLPENAGYVGLHWWGGGEAHADEEWLAARSALPALSEP